MRPPIPIPFHHCTRLLHARRVDKILRPGGRPEEDVVVEVDELGREARDAVEVGLRGAVCVCVWGWMGVYIRQV